MASARLPRTARGPRRPPGSPPAPARRPAASAPWLAVPAADSIFAIALRAASGSTIPGTSTQRPQGHQDTGGLGRGQPQRLVDAGGESDLDGLPGELEVDEVAGSVAGQAAHPQLVEVVAQLLLGHAQFRRRPRRGDPRVGQEVRHHVQQPRPAVPETRTHALDLRAWAAQPVQHFGAQCLRLQHHRVGAVAGDLAGQPVRHPDVDADLLAVAAAERPRAEHAAPAGAARWHGRRRPTPWPASRSASRR